MRRFDDTSHSVLKSDFISVYLERCPRHFSATFMTIVSGLILLPVANLSPEMDSATPISCKPTFKGNLSKLVKYR